MAREGVRQRREVVARNRPIKACLECRRRKGRCDKAVPCAACIKDHRECLYVPLALDPDKQAALLQLKRENRDLENALEQQVAKPVSKRKRKQSTQEGNDGSDSDDGGEILTPTRFAMAASAYEHDDASNDDDALGAGVCIGRMQLTDRIGGYFRPRMADELTSLLEYDAKNDGRSLEEKALDPVYSMYSQPVTHVPYSRYIAPASPTFFSSSSDIPLDRCCPNRYSADIYMKQYWKCVHPLARTVHRPSFERIYNAFFSASSSELLPVSSQALIFAVLFSAIVSMEDEVYLRHFPDSKATWVRQLQTATETLLGRANVAQTTKLQTIQAFVVYLIPLCRADVGRVHSSLVASAIRIAECMGLHRDGTDYELSPTVIHVRRMIWYQLCLLDVRTYEAQGPRPIIRQEDFTTKFPLNVDDNALESDHPPTQDANVWTDMTLSRIRMESNEVIRKIYVDRERVGKGSDCISVTSLLWEISDFKVKVTEKYQALLDPNDPIQDYAMQLLYFQPARMHAMVLHRHHMSVQERMPDRLRNRLINNGLETLNIAMRIETEDRFKPWAWYVGALHQHHMGLLMLMEVFMFPDIKGYESIWRFLDWIFEVPIFIKPEHKARYVVTMVRDHMADFDATRKHILPADMNVGLPPALLRQSGGSSSSQGSSFSNTDNQYANPSVSHYESTQSVVTPQYAHHGSSGESYHASTSAAYHRSSMTDLERAVHLQTGRGSDHVPEMDIDFRVLDSADQTSGWSGANSSVGQTPQYSDQSRYQSTTMNGHNQQHDYTNLPHRYAHQDLQYSHTSHNLHGHAVPPTPGYQFNYQSNYHEPNGFSANDGSLDQDRGSYLGESRAISNST